MAEVGNLAETLRNKDYSISIDNVVNGKLEAMITWGLKVMALCNDGTGRSRIVAEKLSLLGIPAISLEGGLKSIDKDHHLFPYLIGEINKVPFVAVIQTPEELKYFNGILQNMRAHRYKGSASAVESLYKMISAENI